MRSYFNYSGIWSRGNLGGEFKCDVQITVCKKVFWYTKNKLCVLNESQERIIEKFAFID